MTSTRTFVASVRSRTRKSLSAWSTALVASSLVSKRTSSASAAVSASASTTNARARPTLAGSTGKRRSTSITTTTPDKFPIPGRYQKPTSAFPEARRSMRRDFAQPEMSASEGEDVPLRRRWRFAPDPERRPGSRQRSPEAVAVAPSRGAQTSVSSPDTPVWIVTPPVGLERRHHVNHHRIGWLRGRSVLDRIDTNIGTVFDGLRGERADHGENLLLGARIPLVMVFAVEDFAAAQREEFERALRCDDAGVSADEKRRG